MEHRLQQDIQNSVAAFNKIVEGLSAEEFEKMPGGKWSAGQDLKHLIKSLRVVMIVFILPSWLHRLFFGKPNRKSRKDQELQEKYKKAIGKGVKAPRPFVPGKVSYQEKDALIQKHIHRAERLCTLISKLSDAQLEGCIVPHPAVGKVTLRELIVLTYLHTDHHARLLQAKLEGTAAEEL